MNFNIYSEFFNEKVWLGITSKQWYNKVRSHYSGNQKHAFHIVTRSPWPLYASLGALIMVFGWIMKIHNYYLSDYIHSQCISGFGVALILIVMYVWWRDVIRESTFLGYHTKQVQYGLRLGFILFIVSEVMFFFSFFWAFFHSSLSPSLELGSVWPPLGINVLNPLKIPLLNTLILLLSGLTVTWSHHIIRDKKWQDLSGFSLENYVVCVITLFLTIILGIDFTFWQVYEYIKANFYIYDGIYGSTFYMTTGLHGLHVIIGTIFLFVCLIRLIKLHFISNHHLGYEAAIWYWHFVDVVWIFLFLTIYCWGSGFSSLSK